MENTGLTIACFWWGDWGVPYGFHYVCSLYNGLLRNLSIPFKFVCFTDKVIDKVLLSSGIDFREIPRGIIEWPGNFKKLYAYSLRSGLSGRVILMDLDMVIVNEVDKMFSYSGSWCGIKAMKEGRTHIGGGLVSFDHDMWVWVFDLVKDKLEDFTSVFQGQERYLNRHIFGKIAHTWQDLFPGKLVSYKQHVKMDDGCLKEASIVAFHGHPRPHNVKDLKWMKRNWR